ncbi:MAG TPA: biopolymer transporter ExbD [Rhizomicrobium sp.]|jgi:biopolymer transport protein ExbD|nr:biopolymer transporter ExbD [Rhizomicrobium sp.]
MAMQVASPESDEAELTTTINVTPLVDVMLVMLIIFLITIPVIVKVVPVTLPNARNIPTTTKPENIVLAVDRDENIYWNNQPVASNQELIQRLEDAMIRAHNAGAPLPEVHIRADQNVRFEAVGKLVYDAQRASVPKLGFLTEPRNQGP